MVGGYVDISVPQLTQLLTPELITLVKVHILFVGKIAQRQAAVCRAGPPSSVPERCALRSANPGGSMHEWAMT